MTSFEELDRALAARKLEWDAQASVELPNSYHANELAGEAGEAVEAAMDVLDLARFAGRASNIAKKLEREAYGLQGSRATLQDLADECGDVVICVAKLANRFKFPLGEAVRRKFNIVSQRLGHENRMRYEPEGRALTRAETLRRRLIEIESRLEHGEVAHALAIAQSTLNSDG